MSDEKIFISESAILAALKTMMETNAETWGETVTDKMVSKQAWIYTMKRYAEQLLSMKPRDRIDKALNMLASIWQLTSFMTLQKITDAIKEDKEILKQFEPAGPLYGKYYVKSKLELMWFGEKPK